MPTVTNLFISDLHIGSSVALCTPTVPLDDGHAHKASRGQRLLFHYWEELLNHAAKLNNPLVVHIVGDAVETDMKDRSSQLITRNRAKILELAKELIEPLANTAQELYIYRGTTAHVGKSAEAEEDLAKDFDTTVKCPETNTWTWYANLFKSEGIRFDIAHHPKGSGGTNPMLQNNVADRNASYAQFEYSQRRQEPPHILVRGHLHKFRRSYDRFLVEAILLPAFSLKTEHTNRIDPQALSDVGGVFIHTSAGEYEVDPLVHKLEQRSYVVYKHRP